MRVFPKSFIYKNSHYVLKFHALNNTKSTQCRGLCTVVVFRAASLKLGHFKNPHLEALAKGHYTNLLVCSNVHKVLDRDVVRNLGQWVQIF